MIDWTITTHKSANISNWRIGMATIKRKARKKRAMDLTIERPLTQKRGRGRPKMTEAQKAEAKALRGITTGRLRSGDTANTPKRGRPKMTEPEKVAARLKREQAKQEHTGNLAGTAYPIKSKKARGVAVAAAPVRQRRSTAAAGLTKDQTITMLNQRNSLLVQELAVMRRMLGTVYAEVQQAING